MHIVNYSIFSCYFAVLLYIIKKKFGIVETNSVPIDIDKVLFEPLTGRDGNCLRFEGGDAEVVNDCAGQVVIQPRSECRGDAEKGDIGTRLTRAKASAQSAFFGVAREDQRRSPCRSGLGFT